MAYSPEVTSISASLITSHGGLGLDGESTNEDGASVVAASWKTDVKRIV